MTARRLGLSLIAVLLLALSAGCVKVRTTITSDGRVRREVTCEVTKYHQDSARIELQRTFPRSAGWVLREDDCGATVRFRATSRAAKPDVEPFSGSAKVTRVDQGMSTQYTYTDTLTDKSVLKSEDRQYVASVPVEYAVTMPGRITEASATRGGAPAAQAPAEPQGGSVAWKFTMGDLATEDVELTIVSVKHNAKFAFAVVVGSVVVLFLLYSLCVWFAVSRRRRAEAAPLTEDEEEAQPVEVIEPQDDSEGSDDPIGNLPDSHLEPPKPDA